MWINGLYMLDSEDPPPLEDEAYWEVTRPHEHAAWVREQSSGLSEEEEAYGN